MSAVREALPASAVRRLTAPFGTTTVRPESGRKLVSGRLEGGRKQAGHGPLEVDTERTSEHEAAVSGC